MIFIHIAHQPEMKMHFSWPDHINLPLWRWGYSGFATDWSQHLWRCSINVSVQLLCKTLRSDVSEFHTTASALFWERFSMKFFAQNYFYEYLFYWLFFLSIPSLELDHGRWSGAFFTNLSNPINFLCRYILLLKNFDSYVRISKSVMTLLEVRLISNFFNAMDFSAG